MPIYEYVCQACGRKTEVIQNFGERRLRICPRCGGKLKKAFSAPAIHFKGSGFYLTDYGRAKTGGTTEATAERKADSSSKESKAAESKPSEAKESKETKKEKTDSKTESKKESKKKGE